MLVLVSQAGASWVPDLHPLNREQFSINTLGIVSDCEHLVYVNGNAKEKVDSFTHDFVQIGKYELPVSRSYRHDVEKHLKSRTSNV